MLINIIIGTLSKIFKTKGKASESLINKRMCNTREQQEDYLLDEQRKSEENERYPLMTNGSIKQAAITSLALTEDQSSDRSVRVVQSVLSNTG